MFSNRISIIILVVLSTCNSAPLQSFKNPPERCCWSKEFTAKAIVESRIVLSKDEIKELQAVYTLAYDGNRALTGTKGLLFDLSNTENKEGTPLWTIQSINDKLEYSINKTANTCSITHFSIPPVVCVPEIASYVGSNTTLFNNEEIITDTWLLEIGQVRGYTTVSRNGLCIPISGQIFSSETATSTITFNDFVPKLKDPTILDIPKQCLEDF